MLLFCDEILLHVSRGVRWDSDHVVILDDELRAIAEEIVRGGYLDRVHIGLDYFDASINRVAAWVIGTRTMLKALLIALLEPTDSSAQAASCSGDFTARLALLEELKTLPLGAVWDYYCLQTGRARRAWRGSTRSSSTRRPCCPSALPLLVPSPKASMVWSCVKYSLLISILVGAALLGQNRYVAATTRSEWIKFNPVTPLTASTFAQPPAADQPWVRMNMPATADPVEIKAAAPGHARQGHRRRGDRPGCVSEQRAACRLADGGQPARHQGQPQPRSDGESGWVLDGRRPRP